jgi:hypothetical protein
LLKHKVIFNFSVAFSTIITMTMVASAQRVMDAELNDIKRGHRLQYKQKLNNIKLKIV